MRQSFGMVGGETDEGFILGRPSPTKDAGCPHEARPGTQSVLLSPFPRCRCAGAPGGASRATPLQGERTQKNATCSQTDVDLRTDVKPIRVCACRGGRGDQGEREETILK